MWIRPHVILVTEGWKTPLNCGLTPGIVENDNVSSKDLLRIVESSPNHDLYTDGPPAVAKFD